PRRGRRARARAPPRRRPAPEHHQGDLTMGKEFEIAREVDLPGSAEEVWQAVATGEGNAAWMFPNEIDPSIVQDSDRPRHCAFRTEGPGGWFNALEFTIEPRGDGSFLRYVHTGVI